jgi:hypothetical protein
MTTLSPATMDLFSNRYLFVAASMILGLVTEDNAVKVTVKGTGTCPLLLILMNFIIEMVINIVLSPIVLRVVDIKKKL